jgi:AraC-like DNA-binding protein
MFIAFSFPKEVSRTGKTIYSMASMTLSQSSKSPADPLSDVLTALGATVTRHTRLEASGKWALSVPRLDRLKFVALLKGTAWLNLPGQEPQLLIAGDVCLIGRTAYAIASDPSLPVHDGQSLYDGCDVARLGGDDMIGLGGTVTFSPGNADFLLKMLPDFLLVPRSSTGSGAINTILTLLKGEAERGAMGSQIVSARLADVLLVEAIRAYAEGGASLQTGWLGALANPRLACALRSLHDDIGRAWTVAQLAGAAGMSRAAFSAAFSRQVGQPPLEYVRAWRLTLARAALARGDGDIASIGSKFGYTSQSAFTYAFRRAFGASPMRFARAERPPSGAP